MSRQLVPASRISLIRLAPPSPRPITVARITIECHRSRIRDSDRSNHTLAPPTPLPTALICLTQFIGHDVEWYWMNSLPKITSQKGGQKKFMPQRMVGSKAQKLLLAIIIIIINIIKTIMMMMTSGGSQQVQSLHWGWARRCPTLMRLALPTNPRYFFSSLSLHSSLSPSGVEGKRGEGRRRFFRE